MLLRLALAVALVASSVNAQDGSGNKFIPGDKPTLITEDGSIIISGSDLFLNTEDLSTSLNELVARISSLEDELSKTKTELSNTKDDLALTQQQLEMSTENLEMKIEENMNKTSDLLVDIKTMLDTTESDLSDKIMAVSSAANDTAIDLEQKIDDLDTHTSNQFEKANANLDNAVKQIGDTIAGVNKDVAAVKKTADDATAELDIIEKPIKLQIRSRGACVGNQVEYWIDGKKGTPKSNRGIHVITMKADLSAMEKYDVYDTHGSTTHVTNMIKYLQTLKAGRVVLFGIRDEAVARLTDDLKFEIGKFGSKFMTMGHVGYRESWAMIGIKGVPPGYAVEHDGGDARTSCGYGNAPTEILTQEFPRGKIQWLLNDARQKLSNLPSRSSYRYITTTNYETGGSAYANGRTFYFYKYSDSTVIKLQWTDNFRCRDRRSYGYAANCGFEVYIDNQRCAYDGYEDTSDMIQRLHAEGNTHRTNTVTFFCHQLANRQYIKAGKHLLRVYIRSYSGYDYAYLGWPSGANSFEVQEVF